MNMKPAMTMTFSIVALFMCCGFVFGDELPGSDTFLDLREELILKRDDYRTVKEDFQTQKELNDGDIRIADIEAWGNAIIQLDEAALNLIEEAFRVYGDLDEVKEATSGLMRWYEWPRDDCKIWEVNNGVFDSGMPEEEWQQEDNDIAAFTRTCQLGDDKFLYALQFSMKGRSNFRIRARTALYSVLVNHGVVQVHSLWKNENAVFATPVEIHPPFPLGFVDTGGALPSVFVMVGPEGRGNYCKCFLYTWDEQENQWEEELVLRFDGCPKSYDEETTALVYPCTVVIDDAKEETEEQMCSFIAKEYLLSKQQKTNMAN
jgi:hypothetical protein